MKITTQWVTKLATKSAEEQVHEAAVKALKITVVKIANMAIKESPYKYGNNARSIKYGTGPNQDLPGNDLTGYVYSTSGYGGYLETGTKKMKARPYFKPALDKYIHLLPNTMKAELK